MKEKLAALAHSQWAHWMHCLFTICPESDDGTVTIPAHSVERWKRQVATDYADLPEREKESDRAEADKMLLVIEEFA